MRVDCHANLHRRYVSPVPGASPDARRSAFVIGYLHDNAVRELQGLKSNESRERHE
jgi:hypothetical protein